MGRLHPQGKGPVLDDNGLVNVYVVSVYFYLFVLARVGVQGYVTVNHHPGFAMGVLVLDAVNILESVQFQGRVFQRLADKDKDIGVIEYIFLVFPFKIVPIAGVIGGRMYQINALRPDLESVIMARFIGKFVVE